MTGVNQWSTFETAAGDRLPNAFSHRCPPANAPFAYLTDAEALFQAGSELVEVLPQRRAVAGEQLRATSIDEPGFQPEDQEKSHGK